MLEGSIFEMYFKSNLYWAGERNERITQQCWQLPLSIIFHLHIVKPGDLHVKKKCGFLVVIHLLTWVLCNIIVAKTIQLLVICTILFLYKKWVSINTPSAKIYWLVRYFLYVFQVICGILEVWKGLERSFHTAKTCLEHCTILK